MPEPLLLVTEVAAQLRCSNDVVWRLVRTGKLAHHRVSGGLRFVQADIDAYLAQSRVEPAAVPVPVRRTRQQPGDDGVEDHAVIRPELITVRKRRAG